MSGALMADVVVDGVRYYSADEIAGMLVTLVWLVAFVAGVTYLIVRKGDR